MASINITRKLEWDSGHRVLEHESKCAHLHGHRYVAEIKATCNKLDSLGRVIDFSVLKKTIGSWIDTHWDHNMILNPSDSLLNAMVDGESIWSKKQPFVMPQHLANPTAENMAHFLHRQSNYLLSKHNSDYYVQAQLRVVSVRIYETPNCWADSEGLVKIEEP